MRRAIRRLFQLRDRAGLDLRRLWQQSGSGQPASGHAAASTTAGFRGTSITITVGGTTVTAPIIYTSAGGAGDYALGDSRGERHFQADFQWKQRVDPDPGPRDRVRGISTINYSGVRAAVVVFANNSLVTYTNSASRVTGGYVRYRARAPSSRPKRHSRSYRRQSPNAHPSLCRTGSGDGPLLGAHADGDGARSDQLRGAGDRPSRMPGCGHCTDQRLAFDNEQFADVSLRPPDGVPCSDATQIIPTSALGKNSLLVALVGLKQSAMLNFSGNTTTNYTANAAFFQFSQAQDYVAILFNQLGAHPPGTCLTGTVAGSGGGSPPVATHLPAGTSRLRRLPLRERRSCSPRWRLGLPEKNA